MPRLTLELAGAAASRPDIDLSLSIARQNLLFAEHAWLGDRLLPIDTFGSAAAMVRSLPAISHRVGDIERQFRQRGVRAAIVLMAHLWTPLLAPRLKRAGIAYIPVVHDATAHAGDLTGLANRWLQRDLRHADRIITLSRAVAAALVASRRASAGRIELLFHPDLCYGSRPAEIAGDAHPLRLLFFGRILRYKGLPLFVDALDLLSRRGTQVQAGVFGAGQLGACGPRLRALGAEIVNRWIDDREIPAILARHDVVVLSHTSASQSGITATAFGAGLPVVATPVGGLVEQVEHGKTGLVACRVDAEALAEAIAALAEDRARLRAMAAEIGRRSGRRSMAAFADRLVAIARDAADGEPGAAARGC
ncbi:MAG TPA: glycosyltransferase family 4 protein [Stellaceae bacterium]|nr:glycosyltransferase family 4 protein [Stellaceae bacterium]